MNSEDMKMNNLRQGNSGVIVLSYSSYMSHVNLIERVQNKKHKFFLIKNIISNCCLFYDMMVYCMLI